MSVLETFRDLDALRVAAGYRELAPEYIVQELGCEAVRRFNEAYQEQGIPVLIPARNEQEDMPRTLLALARNDRLVIPVVVDNRSTDNTAEVARSMGAIVISAPHGKKMAATQEGLAFILDELRSPVALCTDADTLPPQGWAGVVDNKLEEIDEGNGAAVYGESILWGGGSAAANLLMNASRAAGVAARVIRGRHPHAHGHNISFKFDADGRMREALMSLDPELFFNRDGLSDDEAMAAAVEAAGAASAGTIDPRAMVITPGDRVPDLRHAVQMVFLRQSYEVVTAGSYQQQYEAESIRS